MLQTVTDRTAEDVRLAEALNRKGFDAMTEEEKAAYLAGLKGAYNASDLNRVGEATEYLAGLLIDLPVKLRNYAAERLVAWSQVFDVPYDPADYNITAKTDWIIQSIPVPWLMQRYLSNVVLLRSALDFETDELPTTMNGLTYQGANAIEKALFNLDVAIAEYKANKQALIDNTVSAWFYSGDLNTGEI